MGGGRVLLSNFGWSQMNPNKSETIKFVHKMAQLFPIFALKSTTQFVLHFSSIVWEAHENHVTTARSTSNSIKCSLSWRRYYRRLWNPIIAKWIGIWIIFRLLIRWSSKAIISSATAIAKFICRHESIFSARDGAPGPQPGATNSRGNWGFTHTQSGTSADASRSALARLSEYF